MCLLGSENELSWLGEITLWTQRYIRPKIKSEL